jgi:hypothetical protein
MTVDSAEHLPAAEAVIAAFYGDTGLLSSLDKQQQVDAAVIADRIGAAPVAELAAGYLHNEDVKNIPALLQSVLDALSTLIAWPACLLPVLMTVCHEVYVGTDDPRAAQIDKQVHTSCWQRLGT